MKKTLSILLSLVMLLGITAGFGTTAFAESLVDEVHIYNVMEPVAGARPSFDANQYDIDGPFANDLDRCKFNTTNFYDGISWYDETEGAFVNPDDKEYVFKCGHTYTITLTVMIADTQGGQIMFEYPTRITSTMNNQAAEVDYDYYAAPGEGDFSRSISASFLAAGVHQWDKGVVTNKATTTAFGKKTYTCSVCGETKTEKIKKINPLTAKGKTKTVKYATLKKKNVAVARKNVIAVSKAQGTVTYAKASGNKKITVNKKTGKFTVKKGLKKGTYKVRVKVTAAGNKNFAKKTKTVTVTIKVK